MQSKVTCREYVSSFELFDNLLKAVKAVNKKVGEAILIIIEGHETAFNGF